MQAIHRAGLTAILAFLATGAMPASEAQDESPFSFSMDLSVRHDDNIGFAPNGTSDLWGPAITQESKIFFDDITTRISGTVDYAVIEEASREFVLSATPFYARVSDIDGLSNYGIGVDATYRGEFGPDFTDPWYAVALGYTLIRFDDSDIREGGWLDVELTLGKRFSPKFGVSGGMRYFDRSQEDSSGLCPNTVSSVTPDCPESWLSDEVFDLQKWGAFVHGDFFFTDETALFLEYSYWDGDEASSFPFANSQPTPFADDPVFGPAFVAGSGAPIDYRVWRVDGKQHVVELGVAHQLTEQILLNLTFIHLETSDLERAGPDGPISIGNYRNDAIELSATFSFQ